MTLPKLTLADLARSGHVTRWHSVRTARNQTLAEHHYMVTRISSKLAKKVFGKKLSDSDLLQIIEYASLHDTPELLTGDLPSPLKYHINQICGKNNPIDKIEHEIAPWLTKMREEMRASHPEYLALVKLADIIDAIVFLSIEGIGPHARQVVTQLNDSFFEKLQEVEKLYPSYNWDYAQGLLDKLVQNQEAGKLAFEQRKK